MPLTQPDLAICIPTYNRAEILRATLSHLAENRDLFAEVVICDNASPDHTAEVVREMSGRLKQIRYIRHETNIGAFRNYNACLSQSHYRYQYLLSDDDRILPDAIRIGLRHLEADPEAVAVFGAYEDLNEAGSATSIKEVAEPVRYTSDDRLTMALKHFLLWHPIMRTDVFQRHCFYDDQTFGYWRLVDQLIANGPIWVLPDHFYRHLPTADRLETAGIEPWYLDYHRADWELFLSKLAPAPETSAVAVQLVNERMDTVLLNAQIWARKLEKPLVERDFILRRAAYGQRSPAIMLDWEMRSLMAATLERAVEQLVVTGAKRVFIESGGMNLPALRQRLEGALPSVMFQELAGDDLTGQETGTGDGIIAENWDVFDGRRAGRHQEQGVCRLSWMDLMATLRLTTDPGVRILRGPDGTTHLLRF